MARLLLLSRYMGTAEHTQPKCGRASQPFDGWLPLGGAVTLAAVFVVPTVAGVAAARQVPPLTGKHVAFTATAYCDNGKTKAGVQTRSGVAAADPRVLPVGSVVRLRSPEQPRYEGIYTVMDTGGAVQGRRIDLFIKDCREARQFGLRRVLVRVLRLGWDPQASVPSTGGS